MEVKKSRKRLMKTTRAKMSPSERKLQQQPRITTKTKKRKKTRIWDEACGWPEKKRVSH